MTGSAIGIPTARRIRFRLPTVLIGGVAGITGLLTIADLLSLWLAPPGPDTLFAVIVMVSVGASFAVTGLAGISTGDRGAVPGALFLAAGLLLLTGPLVTALGWRTAGLVAVALGSAVLVPQGLLRVPRRSRAQGTLRLLDLLALALGAACVAAAATASVELATTAGFGILLLLLCAGWLHFELSTGDDRRQLLWLVLGFCASIPSAVMFLIGLDPTAGRQTLIGLGVAVLLLPLPLFTGIAVVAPGVTDVRAVNSRLVVAAVMLTLTVAVYALAWSCFVGLVGTPPGPGWAGVIAAVIAAGYHPVLLRVRATTDELLFGGRADPVDALTRLGHELTAGSSPDEWLAALRAALAVPGVELRVAGEVLARAGAPVTGTEVTELRVGTEHVGDLVVGLPPDQPWLPAATRTVVRLVAGPLAQAVHATRLSERLRSSRAEEVAALEEERRRIRGDLHDGLGPTLTGIAYSADAAANLASREPAEALALIRELRRDAGDAIAEVRRIVEGLRPRALDELGLVAAVRQRTDRLHAADGRRLRVSLRAPERLPTLPAAVEVVAYRVAVEAVTNVARHAGVDSADVLFALAGDALEVTVSDPGQHQAPWRPGVGLSTMRERVERVAGELTLSCNEHGGTVRAVLPLPGG